MQTAAGRLAEIVVGGGGAQCKQRLNNGRHEPDEQDFLFVPGKRRSLDISLMASAPMLEVNIRLT